MHIQDVTNAPSVAPHAEAPNDSRNSESEDQKSGPTEPVGLGAVLIQPTEEMILQTADVSRWHTKSGGKRCTTGYKQPVSMPLVFFVNAHHLEGPKHCRRYHMNKFSDNDKAGKLFHQSHVGF